MVSQKITLTHGQGFHMRPAGVFAGAMGKFQSDVTIAVGSNKVNGKSLMNIIAACIKSGTEVEILCDGPDEKEALAAAIDLIQNGLGE